MSRPGNGADETEAPSFASILNPALVAEARRIELRTKRSLDTETVGRFRSSFRGSGLTFSELREYEPGDEIRRIDWKSSVRTGRTYVKSYLEERTLSLVLAIDCTRSTAFGSPRTKHQRALEFAALITLLAKQSGDAVGLLRFTDVVEEFTRPERKRSQVHRILCSLLEDRALAKATDLRPTLKFLRQSLRKRTVVFLLSDFFAPPFEEDLRFLCAKHDVICVHLGDPPGGALPPAGIVEIADAETGERMVIDTGSESGQSYLKSAAARRVENLKALATRAGADWLELIDHPLRPLMELMNRRARRAR